MGHEQVENPHQPLLQALDTSDQHAEFHGCWQYLSHHIAFTTTFEQHAWAGLQKIGFSQFRYNALYNLPGWITR